MKKVYFYFLLLVLLGFTTVACSANEEKLSVSEMDMANDSASYAEKAEIATAEVEEKSEEDTF